MVYLLWFLNAESGKIVWELILILFHIIKFCKWRLVTEENNPRHYWLVTKDINTFLTQYQICWSLYYHSILVSNILIISVFYRTPEEPLSWRPSWRNRKWRLIWNWRAAHYEQQQASTSTNVPDGGLCSSGGVNSWLLIISTRGQTWWWFDPPTQPVKTTVL